MMYDKEFSEFLFHACLFNALPDDSFFLNYLTLEFAFNRNFIFIYLTRFTSSSSSSHAIHFIFYFFITRNKAKYAENTHHTFHKYQKYKKKEDEESFFMADVLMSSHFSCCLCVLLFVYWKDSRLTLTFHNLFSSNLHHHLG